MVIEKNEKKEMKQTPEKRVEVEKWLNKEDVVVDTEIDEKKLKKDIDTKNELTEQQLKDKEELEKDLASGMKVSEAVGKRSTRLDTMDSRLTVLPFVGDTMTSSAGLLFFIVQNQKLAKKYRLPRTDKIKAFLLQAGDRTLETLVKAPLDTIMSIPFIWWLATPILAPIKVVTGLIVDHIFKANKRTAKSFKKSFEKMLADAEIRNKENPDKEQIDVEAMKAEMDENLSKITDALKYKDDVAERKIEKKKEEKKTKKKAEKNDKQA